MEMETHVSGNSGEGSPEGSYAPKKVMLGNERHHKSLKHNDSQKEVAGTKKD